MTCALLLIFFVLVALSLLSSCGGDEVQEVLLKIQQLKVAANSQSDHAIKIDIRRRVAIGYFSLSLMHHVGGGKFQDDALSAFNEALAVTDNSAAAAVIQLNFFQGILLRTMGRPDESFSVLAAVISEYGSQMHLKDLSNYLCNQAEALVASNQLARARDRYQSAIATNPCHDSAYYGLVKVCRDLADLSKQQWQDLTSTIESLQKSCISQSLENVIGLIADLIGATTVLIGEGASLQTSAVAVDSFTTSTHLRNTNMFTTIDLSESNYRSMDSGSLYWTLFLCAEKISDFAKAWKFLELANAKELQQKSSEFNSALAIQQTQTLKSVFTKQFLTQRAKGSKSRVPIFVVGMMRSNYVMSNNMFDC